MHAAVVRSFGQPPRYEEFPTPQATAEDELLVDVAAAALHPRVRSGAAGSHYTSTDILPLIPGIDGVGRLPNGQQVYFVAPDTAMGTMAAKAVIDLHLSIPLPNGVDPVLVAAAMIPAMSSWVALRRRVSCRPGRRVLVLGATGTAGQLAVQIAKHLGAAQVIAAGRAQDRLDQLSTLGAHVTVSLAGRLEDAAGLVGEAAAEVDTVIDYLWGQPAELIIPELLRRRSDRGRALDWIQIGSAAGPTLALTSVALRSANFRVLGSGQGSVTTAGMLAELPALVNELAAGTFVVNAKAVPLSEVEAIWTSPADAMQRLVFVPGMPSQ